MQIIDTHSHIYAEEFDADRDFILEKAFDSGLQKILMPNVDHTSIDRMMEVEEKYPGRCVSMMGLHPCYVKKNFEKELYLVEDWLRKRKFAAVGEIGIDLHWDTSTRAIQEEAFLIQLDFARKYKLPVVIHSRNAFREAMDIVLKNPDGLSGVFHCFTGDEKDAEEIFDIGFYIGVGGVVTFKNSGLDKAMEKLDLSHVVLETDAPYLAPVPHRGKRNEPHMINLVAEKLAMVKNLDKEEVISIATENSINLFPNAFK
ncbi:MAG: TatD family hydrolase [Cytophagaceae bacterium]